MYEVMLLSRKACAFMIRSMLADLMDAQLQALAELFVKLLVVVLLLSNLSKHLQALLDQVLLDHTQNLVLLKGLTGNVQGQILRINNALNKVQPLRHQLIAIVHDEHTPDVQLDVVALLLGLEEVKWSSAWNKEKRTELELTLD